MFQSKLTIPQNNIWNSQIWYSDTSVTNLCGSVFYNDKRDINILSEAINIFVKNQTAFGIRIIEGRETRQSFDIVDDFEIPVVFFDDMESFDEYAKKKAKQQFETGEFLFRFEIVQVNKKIGILAILSHIISDAWSFGILAKGVEQVYQALLKKRPLDLNIIKGDYFEFVESNQKYLESPKYEKDKFYWTYKYKDVLEPTCVKQSIGLHESMESERYIEQVPVNLDKRIRDFCKEKNVSEAVFFEASFLCYLHSVNPQINKLTIGVPVLNRRTFSEKQTIGMYVSTMPLSIDIYENDKVLDLISRLKLVHMELFRHSGFPFSEILKIIRKNGNNESKPFETVFSYQNASIGNGIKSKWYGNGYSESSFVMHLDNRDEKDTHTVTIDYQTDLFNKEEISLIINRLFFVMSQFLQSPDMEIKRISIVPPEEQKNTLDIWNKTKTEYDRTICVHELFERYTKLNGEKTAVICGDKKLTFKELNNYSNVLAAMLIEAGVTSNDVIPIISDRSEYYIIGMMAVLKAGGAFLPVSPDFPKDRIEYIISDAKAKLVLVYTKKEINLKTQMIYLDRVDYDKNVITPKKKCSSEDICYVIYTSGSTGMPKGVMIRHINIVNFINCSNENMPQIHIRKECRMSLADSAFVFDVSIFEILVSLACGLGVALVKNIYDDEERIRLLSNNNIDVIHSTPTKIKQYLSSLKFQQAIRNVKMFVIGGEVFSEELYRKIRKYSDAEIYNGYGPTEATIGCSLKKVVEKDNKVDISIGIPFDNYQVYIINKNGSVCPVGVAGELCVSGDGVGKGYLNRDELTNERFIPNPFATKENQYGKIMYRTGDLARWRIDGDLEYLGRIDDQVKIHGLRIELGEIESVINSFPDISMAVAADKKDDTGRTFLVGYYMTEDEVDEKSLRKFLKSKLPHYMVPNYFIKVDSVPMTDGGKVKRKELPAPDFNNNYDSETFEIPTDITEKKLANIWSELLGVSRIGRQDDFFDLGGDSLLLISLSAEIEDIFGIKISVKDIFNHTVLSDLAAYVVSADKRLDVIKHMDYTKYEILPQQMAIYVECMKNPDSLAYNMPAWIKLPESVDIEKLKIAIKTVVNSHKSLRTRFLEMNNHIYGVFDNKTDFSFESYTEDNKNSFVRPFDLSVAPLLRVGFCGRIMLFDMHHIISDGTSLNILLNNIFEIYQGNNPTVSEIDYADYAYAFNNLNLDAHKSFFKNMISNDFEPVELPYSNNPGNGGESAWYNLSSDYVKKAKETANLFGITDTMLYMGIYGLLLSKYSGKKDILTSIICTNRTNPEVMNTMGMFVNTLPIYVNARGNTKDYFNDIKDKILGIYAYQDIPFVEISKYTDIQDNNIVNTSFVFQADGDKNLILDGITICPNWIDTQSSKFDITMEVYPNGDEMRIRFEYLRSKYDKKLASRLFKGIKMLIEQLGARTIEDMSVIDDLERNKLLTIFNNSKVKYQSDKCIAQLFTEKAKSCADKTALVFENERFTYSDIDKMSNSLAHILISQGIGRGDVVPIISVRSWHIIVAMLGVIKSGAAYMPVAPSLPEDRINYMFEIAHVKMALCYGCLYRFNFKTIDLNKIDYYSNTVEVSNVNQPDDLCYVVFTSGSTGKPKGVAINHRNVVNYCDNNNNNVCHEIITKECDSIISVTNIVFDIFVTESLLPLLNGMTVYLASDEEVASQKHIAKLIISNKITVLQTTPTKMRSYLLDTDNRDYLKTLKVIILGGEALTKDLCEVIDSVTDAGLYNIYGPAETTVWSTNHKVSYKDGIYDLAIGKPIANTQIYVLGKEQELLPIGTAGELCISGDGVGAGYINRADLTCERFITNPYASMENGHGSVLYRTGDLAKWRDDGVLEYLGRIDNQVKIRGLRIELGEIESVMSLFPDIELAAVTDKKDETGRQYLVGYYTSKKEIDITLLRNKLKEKLPQYMVPNYFMRLSQMPLTASGKTDRKHLPEPDFSKLKQEFVAPQNDIQSVLCDIVSELLSYKIGIDDDFFDIGGDSLKAIEYVVMVQEKGFNLTLQNIYDYPTVKELADYIIMGNVKHVIYKDEDFDVFKSVFEANKITKEINIKERNMKNVLLTGATGFLGIHILSELLEDGIEHVYCLVRETDNKSANERFVDLLHYYFDERYDDFLESRIIVLPGDVTVEGLSDSLWSKKTANGNNKTLFEIDTVIHAAALVKHYGDYSVFEKINVKGTANVLDIARTNNSRFIYVSTMSVSGTGVSEAFSPFTSDEEIFYDETCYYVGQPLDNVYVRSKFEAERVVYNAMLLGVDAKVVRVGNLTNRTGDFKFQKNYETNAFLNRVRSTLMIGCIPDVLMKLNVEFSPVNETAQGIVRVAKYADNQTVFHMNSNKLVSFKEIVNKLSEIGIDLQIVSMEQFNQRVKELFNAPNGKGVAEAFSNDRDTNGNLAYETNIHLKNDLTVKFLKETGFEWSEIDLLYLDGYLRYFSDIGYILPMSEE